MLTSTFSKFAEVELSASGAGQAAAADAVAPMFLQLRPEKVTLNGQSVDIDTLTEKMQELLSEEAEDTQQLLVSLQEQVSAQRLTDLLVVLRSLPHLRVTVLGAS